MDELGGLDAPVSLSSGGLVRRPVSLGRSHGDKGGAIGVDPWGLDGCQKIPQPFQQFGQGVIAQSPG